MDVAHVALWVSDLDRAVEFYTGLGLERQWSFTLDGVENVYVGDEHGELQLRHDPDRTTPIAPNRADVDHVALTVEDTETMVERATDLGVSPEWQVRPVLFRRPDRENDCVRSVLDSALDFHPGEVHEHH